MKNYYEILEVNPKASKEVIEKAYKVLVKRYHPDIYSTNISAGAEQKMKDLNEAFDVLSSDFLRAQYDLELERQIEQERINSERKRSSNNEKKIGSNKKQNNSSINENMQENNITKKAHKTGTFLSIIDILKELLKNKPQKREKKEITKTDVLAVVLTIIATIILGVILWFIPFTNGWMRELLFENPLFNWIGGLFF